MSGLARGSAGARFAGIEAGQISPHNTGIALGTLIGGWHFLWSLIVIAGLGQPLLDFVFWMHFLKPVFTIEAFSITRAMVLLAVTATGGYGVGYLGAVLWNWLHAE